MIDADDLPPDSAPPFAERLCRCGHLKSTHADRLDRPFVTDHCEVTGCPCRDFEPKEPTPMAIRARLAGSPETERVVSPVEPDYACAEFAQLHLAMSPGDVVTIETWAGDQWERWRVERLCSSSVEFTGYVSVRAP